MFTFGRGVGVVAQLRAAGCVAAEEEAAELAAAAGDDQLRLAALVARRVAGEPLAWVAGHVVFCGERVAVWPGVYVPRWQTEPLARRACAVLPEAGLAADLCTGSGAIAAVLSRARPGARVVATDLDPLACRCASANGVEVYEGDLADPVPVSLRGRFDLVTSVVPYVPTEAMDLLPRDVREHEPVLALDGGTGGVAVLERAAVAASSLLRSGGTVLLELGGDQGAALAPTLASAGFTSVRHHCDEDGDLRSVEAVLASAQVGGP